MKPCSITTGRQGDLDILHLSGALDSFSFPKLETAFQELRENGRTRVILDCAELDYISSIAIGALIGFTRSAREHEGDLKLAALSPKIQGIIDLLGFQRILHSYPTIEDAIQAFPAS